MITLIYPYRNRSLQRVKKSLDSLLIQNNKDFNVKFIDYGSDADLSQAIETLVNSYDFATYQYTHTSGQPWNKSRALNIVIKQLDSKHCFIADVDLLFAPNFISKLHELKDDDKAIYFQVGYLSEEESKKDIAFNTYKPKHLSTNEATGLTLFPVKKLQDINGFDEFFHFWGAEDTDVHLRLKNNNVPVLYWDKELLLLHQWHEIYLSKKKKEFNKAFVLNGIEDLNHTHKDNNHSLKVTKVNHSGWGELFSEESFKHLQDQEINLSLTNKKTDIDYLAYSFLPGNTNRNFGITITAERKEHTKDFIKKILGKKTIKHYSMEAANDLILSHLIAHYRNNNYIYEVSENAQQITLKIKL